LSYSVFDFLIGYVVHVQFDKIQNSKVNDVSKVIVMQRANTKSSVGQHGSPTNAKVGSGAMEE
jgi:hypothetical protein